MDEYVVQANDDHRSLPFPDDHWPTLVSSDLLHKQKRAAIPDVLREYFRVLTSGGRLHLEVPALDKLAQAYFEGKISFASFETLVYGKQEHESDFVKTGFSVERMKRLLLEAGFVRIRVQVERGWQMIVTCEKP